MGCFPTAAGSVRTTYPTQSENPMKTLNSISGGKTSAYMAVHYPADYHVFALVRIEDKACAPKDKGLIRAVEDKINTDFIATAEEDGTLMAVLDLEQHTGKEIHWVTGPTFERLITKRNYLPNKVSRFCTTDMKIQPIFNFWRKNIRQPVEQRMGFRANESRRASGIMDRANKDGLVEMKAVIGTHTTGRHAGRPKWGLVPWYKPAFPLVQAGVFKWEIENYWEGKGVRFARLNNCVGCFHRPPTLLKKQSEWQPEKFAWFERMENHDHQGSWRSDMRYAEIRDMPLQMELDVFADIFAEDLESCESGYCGF